MGLRSAFSQSVSSFIPKYRANTWHVPGPLRGSGQGGEGARCIRGPEALRKSIWCSSRCPGPV